MESSKASSIQIVETSDALPVGGGVAIIEVVDSSDRSVAQDSIEALVQAMNGTSSNRRGGNDEGGQQSDSRKYKGSQNRSSTGRHDVPVVDTSSIRPQSGNRASGRAMGRSGRVADTVPAAAVVPAGVTDVDGSGNTNERLATLDRTVSALSDQLGALQTDFDSFKQRFVGLGDGARVRAAMPQRHGPSPGPFPFVFNSPLFGFPGMRELERNMDGFAPPAHLEDQGRPWMERRYGPDGGHVGYRLRP